MIRLLLITFSVVFLIRTAPAQDAKVLEVENIVQTAKGGRAEWAPAVKDQALAVRDRIRTRQRSRASVRLTGLYTMRLEQFTTIELTPGLVSGDKATLDLLGGAGFLFSREKEGEIDLKTPAANGALRGTQVFVRVSRDGRSFYQVLEGRVELSNPQGTLTLNAGEAGEAVPGSAPRRTAVIEARNILQWALYYPAVLDPSELGLSAAEQRTVAASLAAYREGDLPGALEKYPDHSPSSAGGRLYKAGVLLAVGRLDEAELILAAVPDHPGRRALERMIAAVQYETAAWASIPQGAGGLEAHATTEDSGKAPVWPRQDARVGRASRLPVSGILPETGLPQDAALGRLDARPTQIAPLTTAGEALAEKLLPAITRAF